MWVFPLTPVSTQTAVDGGQPAGQAGDTCWTSLDSGQPTGVHFILMDVQKRSSQKMQLEGLNILQV